jgi:hypothetical protein
MTTHQRFALLLAAGLFAPADGLAQGRPGGRSTGSGGTSGGCRSSGGQTSSTPPASTSTPSLSSVYPTPPNSNSLANRGLLYA